MIGVFGGTFNPVHWGHIRTALEIKKALSMDELLMVPAGIPPHRDAPDVDAQVRLAMLQAAVADYPELQVDERELKREGPSYTVDTLQSLREEKGDDISLCLCVGADAFIQLDTWHDWKKLFRLAHIIVVHRPGWPVDALMQRINGDLKSIVGNSLVSQPALLRQQSRGLVLLQKVTNLDISSSAIRQRLARGESVAQWVPPAVLEIIEQQHLYQTTEKSE
ncbi:MAG: nicotinate-nucleotide adenylyltransferase [Gammaproteobacteria bacterium]|jgi:nicotinate-nucleotide adenylyltransferase